MEFPVYILPPVVDLRSAGRMHGMQASSRIVAFLETSYITRLVQYSSCSPGSALLRSLRATAAEFAPWLPEELEGIAEGAAVPLEAIWVINLCSRKSVTQRGGAGQSGIAQTCLPEWMERC